MAINTPGTLPHHTTLDLNNQHDIQTPEGLALKVELAGVGNRIAAFLLDSFLFALLTILSLLAVLAISLAANSSGVGSLKEAMQELSMMFYFIVPLTWALSYHFLQEWLWQGRTVGKYFFKIRVVRKNGQPIGFWEALGRHLARIVDVMFSGMGLIPLMITKSEQRFGDLLVGTIVINEQAFQNTSLRASQTFSGLSPEVLAQDPVFQAGSRLSEEEANLLANFMERKNKLFHPEQEHLQAQLSQYFIERLGLSTNTMDNPQLLTLLNDGFVRSRKP